MEILHEIMDSVEDNCGLCGLATNCEKGSYVAIDIDNVYNHRYDILSMV